MSMEKSPAELLGELDDYDRGFRKRKLLFTALPVIVIFAVYAVMVNAVLKRSAELDAKQAELATTEADLAKRKQELATVASDLAIVRGQYDEVQKANDEAKRKKQEVVATLEQAGSAAAKVEKLEELLTTAPKPSSRAEAMSLWKQGYDAFNSGRKDEARALYERARDTDPTYAA
ncbi:MAG TPA: hypothetical protein VMS65_09995, partial [Polyangiaceae bacterium]|nr:hypothetical protein [Polyangiaceae bacterium]